MGWTFTYFLPVTSFVQVVNKLDALKCYTVKAEMDRKNTSIHSGQEMCYGDCSRHAENPPC
jgi:hypothetical protein